MKLLFWILVSKFVVLGMILFADIPLMPDEAQYWTWSKMLSYCYYSKPCGIAFQIAAGCSLFGDTELGVRFMSLIFSTLLSFSIYFLARRCQVEEKKSVWAALSFSFSPLGIFSGFFATTDSAFVLFWTLALLAATKDLRIAGILIALGALWKWPIYAVWVPIACVYRKNIASGILLSLLGLIPSLVWNIEHNFVTFHHVEASIKSLSSPNPLEFLGAQLALASPIFFILIIAAVCKVRGFMLLSASTIFYFALVFLASFFEKVQGNWAVACYPTAFILMAVYASRRWLIAGSCLSLLLIGCTLCLPYRINPFKQGLGAQNLKEALAASGYNPKLHFLFSDRYQVTSLLSFYADQQKRAYFFNLQNLRYNQFVLLPSFDKGSSGYFVEFTTPDYKEAALVKFKEQLEPYFEQVTILPPQTLYREAKVAVILRADSYNGKVLPKPTKY